MQVCREVIGQLLSLSEAVHLCFEQSLSGLELPYQTRLVGKAQGLTCLPLPVLGLQACAIVVGSFYMGSGNWIQVLMLARQILS